jgi:hypothetical protein
MMEYKNSTELMQKMADKSNGVCLLAFSTGKDAVCAWVELRKYFKEIHPVYYYSIPGLSFVEKSLTYYENFFETKITRLPNPNFIRQLKWGMFQTKARWDIIKGFQFPEVKREELCEWLKEDRNINTNAYTAIGNRAEDNLSRQRAIMRRNSDGSIKEIKAHNDKIKTFFPVFDYTIEDVVRSIREAKVKLPVDYRIWGKTFDGMDYRFIKPIKELYPDDYEIIKSYFPLTDAEILRYENI